MKFRNLVQNWLQAQFGNARTVKQWTTHAHSGAQIQVNPGDPDRYTGLGGEIPSSYPSVTLQLSDLVQSKAPPAGDVDLVLLDGGINDITVLHILNVALVEFPANGPNWVRSKTNELCVGHMAQLLPQVTTQFPNAAVVVTGYFPIASAKSNLAALGALLFKLGVPIPEAIGLTVGLRAMLVDRSNAFNDVALHGFTDLVSRANQGLPAPRVALAWPEFSPDNCFAAPNSYLFNVAPFNGLAGDEAEGIVGVHEPPANSVNDVAWRRANECRCAGRTDWNCSDACMGHPNVIGAQVYADTIINQLQHTLWARLGLPAPPPPPRAMNVSVVQTGADANGPAVRIGPTPIKLRNWMIVSAVDKQTGKPIDGIVSVARQIPSQAAVGDGRTGQKVYFGCEAQLVPVKAGVEPGEIDSCRGIVSAPGYANSYFSVAETTAIP
jgi:hypothetical protein